MVISARPPVGQTSSANRSAYAGSSALDRTKKCPLCDATYARTAHLNRHIKTHTREGLHVCDICQAQFTRTDVLSKHRVRCLRGPYRPSRQKSCQACASARSKCDKETPCGRCRTRHLDCVYVTPRPPPDPSTNAPLHQARGQSDSLSPPQLPTLLNLTPSPPNLSTLIPPPVRGLAPPLPHSLHGARSMPNILAQQQQPASQLWETRSAMSASTMTTDLTWTTAASHLSTEHDTPECGGLDADFGMMFGGGGVFDDLFSDVFGGVRAPGTAVPPYMQPHEPHAPVYSHHSCSLSGGMAPEAYGQTPPSTGYSGDSGSSGSPYGGSANGPPPSMQMGPFPPQALIMAQTQGERWLMEPMEEGPTPAELIQYENFFYVEFLPEVRGLHRVTFTLEDKPLVLRDAIRACGALYAGTERAAEFVHRTTHAVRETLTAEFSEHHTAYVDDTTAAYKIIAAGLLQTVMMFHPLPEERAKTHVFHRAIVTMVRRSGLMERNTTWTPPDISDDAYAEYAWREWIEHEVIKRVVFLSLMHDMIHVIFFGLSPCCSATEYAIALPCDDMIWHALSAEEWLASLRTRTAYGTAHERMVGYPLNSALAHIRGTQCAPGAYAGPTLPPLAHVLLVHIIVADIYTVSTPADPVAGDKRAHVFRLQYALHNWLASWLQSPETPGAEGTEEVRQPKVYANCLPLYWLGQLTLTAYQEGLAREGAGEEGVEARFEQVRRWLGRVRKFLWGGKRARAQTLLWDGMMKIRLEGWREDGLGLGEDVLDDSQPMGYFQGPEENAPTNFFMDGGNFERLSVQ